MRVLSRAMMLIALVAVLFGCVNTELNEPADTHYTYVSPQKRVLQLQRITAWHNSGAFSVTLNGKVKAANFVWDQSGRYRYRIQISSALNLAGVTLTGVRGRATLWRTATKFVRARSPEVLMQKELGWSLPISNLFYWVRDLPAPGRWQNRHYDQYGHLRSLEQQGWLIRWTSYMTKNGVDFPRLIELYRPNIYIRIVVKNWLPLNTARKH
ncbi:MAG: lipoprotein insertase outer membrane protein LolB [Gammaproteobacteria bacterium]|nr:lipoprotein insertase outer membrane protein LolB [Gammaproteobacteria bacterium]MCH9743762.1 lipoprotein insertase outer membrane protein LolB [Gammaproteobacteria bacterium]